MTNTSIAYESLQCRDQGTGKPEQLKGGGGTLWSRRITKKHRLIYEIIDTVVHVDVLSTYGHYDDK